MGTLSSLLAKIIGFGDAHVGGTQAIFSFVLIVIGFIQAAIYWNIRADGVRRDAAVIFVRSFNAVPIINAKDGKIKFWYFSSLIENAGATNAVNIITRLNLVEQPNELPNDFNYPDYWDQESNEYNRITLGPKHANNLGGIEVEIEKIVAAKNADFKIYMYGWIEYNDAFRRHKTHRTEFCIRLRVEGDPVRTNCAFNFERFGDFNGADEHCYRKRHELAPVFPAQRNPRLAQAIPATPSANPEGPSRNAPPARPVQAIVQQLKRGRRNTRKGRRK